MQARIRRPVLSLAAVFAALAALAGCGGGGGTLSKSEFIARGDEICRQAHDQFRQLQQNPPASAAEAATLTRKLIDISQSELTEIRDLNAPSEVQPALDRYLEAREQGIAVLEKGLEAAQDKNARAYAAAQAKVTAGQVHRLKLAKAVGFSECSRPGGASATTGG